MSVPINPTTFTHEIFSFGSSSNPAILMMTGTPATTNAIYKNALGFFEDIIIENETEPMALSTTPRVSIKKLDAMIIPFSLIGNDCFAIVINTAPEVMTRVRPRNSVIYADGIPDLRAIAGQKPKQNNVSSAFAKRFLSIVDTV